MDKDQKNYLVLMVLYMVIAAIAAIRFDYWPVTWFFGFVAGIYLYCFVFKK